MLNALFIIFIIACFGYLLVSEKKEVPLIILLHAFIQYIITIGLWLFRMTPSLTGLLLSFIVVSSLLLIWGRGLNYSQELQSIKLLFSMVQWMVIIGLFVFSVFGSPYYHMVPTGNLGSQVPLNTNMIHPVIKLSGNILMFTFFFQVITHWGEKWSFKKSLFDILPIVLLFLLLSILRIFNSTSLNHPFT